MQEKAAEFEKTNTMNLLEPKINPTAPISPNCISAPPPVITHSMDVDNVHDYEHEINSNNSSSKINSGADKTFTAKVNSDPGYSPEVLTGSQDSASPHESDTEQPLVKSMVQINVCDNNIAIVSLCIYVVFENMYCRSPLLTLV